MHIRTPAPHTHKGKSESPRKMERTDDVAGDGKVHLLVVLNVLRGYSSRRRSMAGRQGGRAVGRTGQLG